MLVQDDVHMIAEVDDLLCRAQSGERTAFDRLVETTAPLVRAWLALHLRQLDQVDDLAQEVYLYVFDHLADYRPQSNGLAWLKVIALNQALAHGRAHQRRSAAHARYSDAVRVLVSEAANELPDSDHPDLVGRLRVCVERLSQRARALIMERYGDERSVEQLAHERSQSANQVSVTLWRVRRTLADCIASQADGVGS